MDYWTVSRLGSTMPFSTEGMAYLRIFKEMIPVAWFHGTCIDAIPDKLEEANKKRLSDQERFVWLGI